MKRRRFLTAAGLGVAVPALAAPALAAPALAQAAPELKWRLTSGFPKSLDALYGTAEVFARQVADLTDGRFRIQVFPAGEIVPAVDALEAVRNGTVEACHTFAAYAVERDPTFAVATGVPFGLNARQQSAWFVQGGGAELFDDFFRAQGVVGIPCGNTGAQMGGWFRREVKGVADLNGLKMRIGGLAGQILSRLGVVPQQTPRADVQAALEKGTIDAADWVAPYDDEKLGLAKVAPYYYYPGWWDGGPTVHAFVNREQFDGLPKPYQAALTSAAAYAATWLQARYDVQNTAALRRLMLGGAILRPFPTDVMEACFKASGELYAEIGARNESFRRAVGAMTAFRGDSYLWWQVAEFTYDNFMIRAVRTRG